MHVAEAHGDSIKNEFDKEQVEEKKKKQEEEEKVRKLEEEKKFAGYQRVNLEFDRINKIRNDRNRDARLGQTGKYYCGGLLDSACACCA